MATRDVNLRWQRDMAPYFEDLEGRRPDQGMLVLEEVFHLD
jgi:L-rhamnose mutarotase